MTLDRSISISASGSAVQKFLSFGLGVDEITTLCSGAAIRLRISGLRDVHQGKRTCKVTCHRVTLPNICGFESDETVSPSRHLHIGKVAWEFRFQQNISMPAECAPCGLPSSLTKCLAMCMAMISAAVRQGGVHGPLMAYTSRPVRWVAALMMQHQENYTRPLRAVPVARLRRMHAGRWLARCHQPPGEGASLGPPTGPLLLEAIDSLGHA